MRIGVNLLPMRVEFGGSRRAALALLQHLVAIQLDLPPEQRHQYVCFAPPSARRELAAIDASPDELRIISTRTPADIVRARRLFDLYFAPMGYFDPPLLDKPSVALLHDIQEQHHPEWFPRHDLLWRGEHHPLMARRCTRLVTPSQFSADAIAQAFKVPASKIRVIPLAPQAGLLELPATQDPRIERIVNRGEYVLYPANWHPHKNHEQLITALAIARYRRAATRKNPITLVLCGRQLADNPALAAVIARYELESQVIIVSDVAPGDLRRLYQNATACVLPSLYEGFGMPAAEAMACGCPLACSDIPPFREVAGEACIHFNPQDSGDIATAILRLANDQVLRRQLTAKGYERIKQYQWAVIAEEYPELFQDALTDWQRVLQQPATSGPPTTAFAPKALTPVEAIDYGEKWWPVAVAAARSTDTTLSAQSTLALRQAVAEQPKSLLYISECICGQTLCRVRQTADGLWRIEGELHPEMVWINIAQWRTNPPSKTATKSWFALVHEAMRDGRVVLVDACVEIPRTSSPAMLRYLRGEALHYRTNGSIAWLPSLRGLERPLKRAAQMLPLSWQHAATRIWYWVTS